jgi:large subunit GTPase 1
VIVEGKANTSLDFATPRDPNPTKLVVGLVGYPNVGKSSTINALLGAKKVSVSSTPGKTKHFQTLVLSDDITLCDCPGLVFPQFANTQADMVVDGVLPIDQMREYSAPVDLLCQRIPREILEGVYGIRIDVKDEEEGGTGLVGWEDLLSTYASTSHVLMTRKILTYINSCSWYDESIFRYARYIASSEICLEGLRER